MSCQKHQCGAMATPADRNVALDCLFCLKEERDALKLQKRELIDALRDLVARYSGIIIADIEEQELGYAERAHEAIAKAEGKPVEKRKVEPQKPEPYDPPQGTIGDPPRNPNWSVDVGE